MLPHPGLLSPPLLKANPMVERPTPVSSDLPVETVEIRLETEPLQDSNRDLE